MKARLSKFITIGVMLLLLALIVSRFPEIRTPSSTQNTQKTTTVSKLENASSARQLRAN
jgi:hypothetical protein